MCIRDRSSSRKRSKQVPAAPLLQTPAASRNAGLSPGRTSFPVAVQGATGKGTKPTTPTSSSDGAACNAGAFSVAPLSRGCPSTGSICSAQ
eukprot:8105522-Alexandrium_andersonii.AAC.1